MYIFGVWLFFRIVLYKLSLHSTISQITTCLGKRAFHPQDRAGEGDVPETKARCILRECSWERSRYQEWT